MCLQCPICLDKLCSGPCCSINCGHTFHQTCIFNTIRNSPNVLVVPCPCCRTDIGGIRKIFVDQEICTHGVEYAGMKKRLLDYEKKIAEQNTMVKEQTAKITQLRDTCEILKDNFSVKENQWRQKVLQLEQEMYELQLNTRLPSKSAEVKTPARDLSALKVIYEQNMKRAESRWEEKISQMEKKLYESDYKFRRQVKLQREFEIELRKKLEIEIREELNKEFQSTDQDSGRRKLPFRECRKRVRSYKE